MASIVRVLIVDHVSALGGAEFSLETLVDRMPPGRCQYTVAVPGPGLFVDLLRRKKQLPVEQVRVESWRWWTRTTAQTVKFVLTLPLQAWSLLRWMRFLRRLQPDIVHLNVSRLVEPLVAARALRIPTVVHFRDIPSRQRARFVLGRRAFYRLMNLAGAWIANSNASAADIRPYCRRALFVIPNGLDLERFDRARAAGRSHVEDLLLPVPHHVAMIGGLNTWKRQEDFIELAARVSRTRSDTAFYLVGHEVDRDYSFRLRRNVEQASLEATVRFVGHIDHVPAFVDRIDVLVHTTPFEPFGRVFLEAMAASRPVIAVASGGAADVVVDGGTGVLVPPGALDRMAAELNALLDDGARRRRLGVAGRQRVETHYAIERHCEAVALVYDSLLQTAAGSRARRETVSPAA